MSKNNYDGIFMEVFGDISGGSANENFEAQSDENSMEEELPKPVCGRLFGRNS